MNKALLETYLEQSLVRAGFHWSITMSDRSIPSDKLDISNSHSWASEIE
jgi:hypothetical protein